MRRIIYCAFCLFFGISNGIYASRHTAKIEGSISFLKSGERLLISTYSHGYSLGDIYFRNDTLVANDHRFFIAIPVTTAQTCVSIRFLSRDKSQILLYYLSPDDDIFIRYQDERFSFDGTGSYKATTLERLEEIKFEINKSSFLDPVHFERYFEIQDSIRHASLLFLDSVTALSPDSIYLLYAYDCVLKAELSKIGTFNRMTSSKNYFSNVTQWSHYQDSHDSWCRFIDSNMYKYQRSVYFYNYVIERYIFDSCTIVGRMFDIKACFDFVCEKHNGIVREELIGLLLDKFYSKIEPSDLIYISQKVAPFVKSNVLKKYVEYLFETKMLGVPGFKFVLEDEKGLSVRLHDFKGFVILLDFWFNGCGACRVIHPILDSVRSDFNGRPFKIISVSVDEKRDSWIKGIYSGKYTSPGNVNVYTGGRGQEDDLIKFYRITGYPTLILFDKEGCVIGIPQDPRMDQGAELSRLISKYIER